jgi:hypothetical protein
MRQLSVSLGLVLLVSGFAAVPQASAQQSVSFYIGGFLPRGADGRPADDVLFQNQGFLLFDMSQFNGATVGGDWLVALGDHFDAGLGVGYSAKTVPTAYTGFVNADGSEIVQELRLRITPVTATFRFLPFGHRGPVQPYIGAGAGIYSWRYSESGAFIDTGDHSIFHDSFAASHTDVGPVVLGGLSVPLGTVGIGAEIRYQAGTGTLPSDLGFAGSKIDLGGISYVATVRIPF